MALDPSLRKQLTEAREAILAEIDELEFRTKNPAKGGAPDYRGPYDELQRQLREIDELLGTDEDAKDCEDSEPVAPDYFPVPTLDPMSSAPAKNVVVDPASLWNMNAVFVLGAGIAIGAAVGAAMHHLVVGILVGASFGAPFAVLASRSD